MRQFALIIAFAVPLAGCGSPPAEAPAPEVIAQSEAEEFAARIKGTNPQPAAAAPSPAAPATPTPLQTATAPIPPKCKSDIMREFLGRTADDPTRREILAASEDVTEVRFIAPGSDYIRPDPTHPRLNIMIDATGVIRDARCG